MARQSRRVGCGTMLLATGAGVVALAVVLGGVFLILSVLGRGGAPPVWVGWVAIAAGVGAVFAVVQRAQKELPAPPPPPAEDAAGGTGGTAA